MVNLTCKPMKCSGFYPWGAKFCHICGKPYIVCKPNNHKFQKRDDKVMCVKCGVGVDETGVTFFK